MVNCVDTERRSELWEAAMREAERFKLPDNWQEGRGEPIDIYVVDSESTRDCDDGFSKEDIGVTVADRGDGHFVLKVSIVDVASFINGRDTSAMDAYAHEVGYTQYLAYGNKPMIPRLVSENFLSLVPKEHQLTTPVVTYSIPILPNGSLGPLSFELRQARPIRLSYNEVARLRKQPDSPLGKELGVFEDAAKRMRRFRTGSDEVDADAPGQLIVEESMIAVNTGLPLFMLRNNIPQLFRNHHIREQQDGDSVRVIADPAYYWPQPLGHDGLRLPRGYGHETSPIRRNPDRINQANLLAFKKGEPYPYAGAKLKAEADHLWDLQEQELARRRRRTRRVGGEAVIQAVTHQKAA